MELNKSLYNLEWDTNPTKTKGSCGTYLKAFYNNIYYKAPIYDNNLYYLPLMEMI